DFLALVRVPHLYCLVLAAADDAFAIGAERHAAHDVRVSRERADLLALVRGPHLHRLVSAAAGDAFAVRTERHAADLVGVSLEGEDFLALLRVPNLDLTRLVGGVVKVSAAAAAAADDAFAVGADCHAVDMARVSPERENLL